MDFATILAETFDRTAASVIQTHTGRSGEIKFTIVLPSSAHVTLLVPIQEDNDRWGYEDVPIATGLFGMTESALFCEEDIKAWLSMVYAQIQSHRTWVWNCIRRDELVAIPKEGYLLRVIKKFRESAWAYTISYGDRVMRAEGYTTQLAACRAAENVYKTMQET